MIDFMLLKFILRSTVSVKDANEILRIQGLKDENKSLHENFRCRRNSFEKINKFAHLETTSATVKSKETDKKFKSHKD